MFLWWSCPLVLLGLFLSFVRVGPGSLYSRLSLASILRCSGPFGVSSDVPHLREVSALPGWSSDVLTPCAQPHRAAPVHARVHVSRQGPARSPRRPLPAVCPSATAPWPPTPLLDQHGSQAPAPLFTPWSGSPWRRLGAAVPAGGPGMRRPLGLLTRAQCGHLPTGSLCHSADVTRP